MDYTHDEWVKAREWAERIANDAEKSPWYYEDRCDLVLAAIAALDLPEPDKPPRTFADMTDEEHRNYIGGAVETVGQRGWYVGIDAEGYDFYLVIGINPSTGRVKAQFPSLEEIVPLPDEPRLVIPGVTRPHVQQEPPEDMQGWWVTDPVYGRVLVTASTADCDYDVPVCRAGNHPTRWARVSTLTDWSRERDIEEV